MGNPSGTAEDVLFGVDLRGLGWAYSFAAALDPLFERALYTAHLKIGNALDKLRGYHIPSSSESAATLPETASVEGVPRITFESERPGIAVFLKPPGWEVDDEHTRPCGKRLSRYLQWKYPWSSIAHDPEHAFGIIHRLDVPSSGLILTGTTYEGHYVLKWQLDTAQIAREYVVLCHGWVSPKLQVIDAPVHHIPQSSAAPAKSVGRSMVIEMGKPAKTLLRVLAHLERGGRKFSLVVIRICTGRRHQIRAHLHHIWHPTVADGKYTRAAIFADDLTWWHRHFLHRQRLV